MKTLDIILITFCYIIAIIAGITGHVKQDPYYLIMTFIGAVSGTAVLIDHLRNNKK